MAKFHFTNKAVEDISDIWGYTIEEWSQNQAEKYYNLIMASCDDLANNPKLGKHYDIISKEYLGYRCGKHIIFYWESSEKEITIERVLHEMMDLKGKL